MSVTRVRVEAKPLHPNASFAEKERNFKIMFSIFKKAVNDSGILTRYKEKQTYESPGQKRRRKNKEAALQRRKEDAKLHTRLRERFG